MLFMLVNKLGDPDKKVASSAMHLLNRLLTEHPAMKVQGYLAHKKHSPP